MKNKVLFCSLFLAVTVLVYAIYARNEASEKINPQDKTLNKYFKLDDVNSILKNPQYPDDVRNAVILKTINSKIEAAQSKANIPSAVKGMMLNNTDVPLGEMPWMVDFTIKTSIGGNISFCGGSLITEKFVLTAAHCFFNPRDKTKVDTQRMEARLNSVRPLIDVNVERHRIANVYIYDGYAQNDFLDPSSNKMKDDLAIIELALPSHVQPLPLFAQNDAPLVQGGATAIVAGWGLASPYAPPPSNLHQGAQQLISTEQCVKAYSAEAVTENMLCSIHSDTSHSSICLGDGGGPLLIKNSNSIEAKPKYELLGVISKAESSCSGNYPAIHTRVSKYRNWIKEITGLAL